MELYCPTEPHLVACASLWFHANNRRSANNGNASYSHRPPPILDFLALSIFLAYVINPHKLATRPQPLCKTVAYG
eukprot:2921926-Pleurochrysis_carterae.AAC.1